MRAETAESLVAVHCPPGTYPEQWDVDGLKESIDAIFDLQPPIDAWLEEEAVEPERITERLQDLADAAMAEKIKDVDPQRWDETEKNILLQTLDHFWKEHLSTLDALRAVIHLRSYAQKKPIDEYKQEAFLLFERLLIAIREDVTRVLMRAQVQLEAPPPPQLPDFITQHLDPFSGDDDSADIDFATGAILSNLPPLSIPQPDMPAPDGELAQAPVSRNAPCPCGSGRKYKHCHGQLA
jgi:preprotein translocase subunit SecA